MKKIILVAILSAAMTACAQVRDDKPDRGNDVGNGAVYGDKGDILEGGVIRGTETAVIPIAMNKDGMPKVLLDPIIVKEGQRVVWVGPKNMTIRFPERTPFKKHKLSTRNAVVNAVVPRLRSDEKEVKFKYDIIVDGVVLDPMMIVRQQH